MNQERSTASDRERQEATIKLLLVTVQLAVLLWVMIPDHQRKAMGMRAALRCQKAAQRLAMAAGRNGMALELAAGQHAGRPWYEVARWMMTEVTARAEDFYERQRKG